MGRVHQSGGVVNNNLRAGIQTSLTSRAEPASTGSI
jgi:hypothetical protein